MKHLKLLALAAVSTGVLLAFPGAGPASASRLCATTVSTCPENETWAKETLIDFSLNSGTSDNLQETGAPDGKGETLDTCKGSTIEVTLTNSGGAERATAQINNLTWSSCTFPTTTTVRGNLEVASIAGTSNGTVIADEETRVTINTIVFGSCIYTIFDGKSMGDITEGKPAIFHANAVAHKTAGSEFVCPTTSVWSATYTLTFPKETLSISAG